MTAGPTFSELVYQPEDDYFGAAFVDVDERRQGPCPHRFVHGGFAGCDTRFAMYFPEPEVYAGRFLTSVEGGAGGHESRAIALREDQLGSVPHAFSVGAYVVESNGGHIAGAAMARSRGPQPGSVTAYRATEQATRFGRHLAEQMYGAAPHHGYIFGGSGGGWRTILAIENTTGIWDGAVAYISPAGHGVSFPSIVSNSLRVLGPQLADVVAAWEPGGSGDPFTTLSTVQREELTRLYRAGLQPGAEFQLENPQLELNVLMTTSQMHADFDAAYFTDFWTLRGYAGADGELDTDVLEVSTEVTELVASGRPGIKVREPVDDPRGAQVRFTSGALAGRRLRCLAYSGDVLVLDGARADDLAGVRPGDRVELDNRDYLAYCHAYRHQVDLASVECAQFVVSGRPIYPQRRHTVADLLAGVKTSARFTQKLIYIANLQDTLASPVGGTVNYLAEVRDGLGDGADDQLRVWLNDHAAHRQGSEFEPGYEPEVSTRLVDWHGSVARAIEDLIAWTEGGVAPAADSRFEYADGRISLPANAEQRGGIQPVVVATVCGADTATASAGSDVEFTVRVEVPPGGGTVVAVEWNFEGTESWQSHPEAPTGVDRIFAQSVIHRFDRTGTYFPSVRAWAGRPGPTHERTRVPNLARVRVNIVRHN